MSKYTLYLYSLVVLLTTCLESRDRSFLYNYIPKNSIGCEVGVFQGNFSQQLVENTEPKKIYLIDPWTVFRKNTVHSNESFVEDYDRWECMYQSVCDRFAENPSVEIIRDRGEAAADLFKNEFFDWIYVDGDHSYEGALVDFIKFFPRLKSGGVMIADDYTCEGVRKAFMDFRKICKDIKSTKVEVNQLIIFKK